MTWTRSTRPAAISARFIDRLPWERKGTSDSSLSRATTSMASPRTTAASGQSRGSFRVVETTVAGRFLILVTQGSRTQSSVPEAKIGEHPIRVGSHDHPLLIAVDGNAVVETLGALLAPKPPQSPLAAPKPSRLEKTSNVYAAVMMALLECS